MKNVTRKLVIKNLVIKNQVQPLLENEIFETSWLYWIFNSISQYVKNSLQTSLNFFLKRVL